MRFLEGPKIIDLHTIPIQRFVLYIYAQLTSNIGFKIQHLLLSGWPSLREVMQGGGKIATAMIYLSSVEAGGRTIFPFTDMSVAPTNGNLLYWTAIQSNTNYHHRYK